MRLNKSGLIILLLFLSSGSLAGIKPLDRAEERVKQYRTRQVMVQLFDRDNNPVSDTQVIIKMQRHQFLFGCNLYLFGKLPTPEENQRYLELWKALFNYATVPFYFRQYQPESGKTQEARLKEMVKWCKENQIKIKGHPLIWHFPAGNPDWLPDEPEQVEVILKKRILELVSEFPEIEYWDVVNEPTVSWVFDTPVANWENPQGPVSACKKALEWTRSAGAQAHLIINDYNVKFGYWSFAGVLFPKKTFKLIFDPVKHYPFSYYRFLSELKNSGGDFDAVGIQTHTHLVGKWSMNQLWRVCERYARLGLPLQFSEVTVISGKKRWILSPVPEDWTDWKTTPEGEKKQAEYVEKFYTLLFSHPSVEAITWWDLSDYNAWMGAPAGLVRKDLSPKPAYYRLYYLIKEKWWTNFEGKTDREGKIILQGFCGDYLLKIPEREFSAHFTIDCQRPDGQVIEVKVQE